MIICNVSFCPLSIYSKEKCVNTLFIYVYLTVTIILAPPIIIDMWGRATTELFPGYTSNWFVTISVPTLCLFLFLVKKVEESIRDPITPSNSLKRMSDDFHSLIKIGAGGFVWIGAYYFTISTGNWFLGALLAIASFATMFTKD